MRVSDKLIKCVGFVSRDTDPLEYRGTVFVVSVSDDNYSGVLHLITARHVAEAVGDEGWVLAFNGTDGMPRFIKNGGGMRWFFHPTDEAVDVAILPFASAIVNKYDLQHIPVEMFATEERIEEYSIGLGDEIIVVGLFTEFFGTSHLIPIVRTGNIAMMPIDKLLSSRGPIEVYLAEGRSIGGLSGSPVLCRSTVNLDMQTPTGEPARMSGLGPMHLLGLMIGHWDMPVDFSDEDQPKAINMGVSAIVPAKVILEVLNNPQLVQLREMAFAREAKAGRDDAPPA
jgi:hypothetical protein